jgi:redox-sensitive bicupin YhaK (pirin superfamily)
LEKEWVLDPHDNMEIITIPLEGDLAHKDSMGKATIKNGDVQVMRCRNRNTVNLP